MGLRDAEEPRLTEGSLSFWCICGLMLIHYVLLGAAIIPLTNHGLPSMSMGFLLPKSTTSNSTDDTPIVWRGLMVQKAVQQLLFDVDWTSGGREAPLDVLVIDMPPGTGDVPLTLGQLVKVNGMRLSFLSFGGFNSAIRRCDRINAAGRCFS